MILYGYELSSTYQSTHLIRPNETFTVIEIERGSATGLRRFKLMDANDKSAGIIYEDGMPARFLEGK